MRMVLVCTAAWLVSVPGLARGGDDGAPPLLDGLGKYSRTVTTSNPTAQKYVAQGLVLLFAFNHDEAIRSFRHAAALDPACPMAHWGVAAANGPHINNPAMPPERVKAAWEALAKAREHAGRGTPVERSLIESLNMRYREEPVQDRGPLDRAYAKAMKEVWEIFPDDPDVGALYAEALMDLRPWDLWSADGQPRPETPEIVATLEAVLKKSPDHPLALHLYVHAIEASPEPGKADAAADRLRDVCPGLAHLVHMPSHIDVRRGRWQAAVEANERAIAADRKYTALVPRQGFYRVYMSHNHHMLAFACMMQGQSKRALEAARTLLAGIPQDWLDEGENAAIADGLFALPVEVMMRFGKWDEILNEPEPAATFPVARAIWRSARGVAQAAKGNVAEARKELRAFRAIVAGVPDDRPVGNSRAGDVFAVADHLLEGEILVREGRMKEGLAELREAAAREDGLGYDEPPDWIHPVRHALGAALLKAGHAAEAEQVYRDDLKKWPHNGWSLYGLAASLKAQGKAAEAAEARKAFEAAWKRADVTLTASCFCLAEGK